MATFHDFYIAGNIPEDVIRTFYDISPTDRKFSGAIEQDGAASAIKEYFEHTLNAPNKNNAVVDGADVSTDSTSQGDRRKSPCQLTEHVIKLGDQAENSDGFGPNITKLDTQLEYRTQESYRDIEAATLSENASVIPTDAVAGKLPGFFAAATTNVRVGAGGSGGGWNSGTGVFDAPTPGTPRALPESQIHEVLSEISVQGGMPDMLQMIPQLKSKFSNFMMTSSARIGAIYTPTQGGGNGATAVASIQMFESDFGAMEVISNPIMQPEVATPGSERTNLAIIDSRYWSCATQWDPRAKRLGSTGHGETWLVNCSKTLCALNERSSGAVRDIDYAADMVP